MAVKHAIDENKTQVIQKKITESNTHWASANQQTYFLLFLLSNQRKVAVNKEKITLKIEGNIMKFIQNSLLCLEYR